uniref:Uncharacterized protein n=1 Tax=Salarias fasciatus TaxID=181472 RepID=A0A672F562_SALFA
RCRLLSDFLRLKSKGQTEVKSPEKADYYLVFCPVVSRVGTDVIMLMLIIVFPAGKAVVLVVMHHTFNPEQVIPPSRRLVTDPRVRLTLDCLFHQNKLLSCQLNKNMEKNVMEFFRAFTSKSSDGPVPADREGEPGSMDQENDTDNMEVRTLLSRRKYTVPVFLHTEVCS